jgi:putative radical SAM enzyme (TIGR03279 family)
MSCRSPQTGEGVVVATVEPRTGAARAGLRPGDRIVAINGAPLRDAIDFHFHAGDEHLRLSLEREGRTRTARLTRRGARLGLQLEPPRPSEIATCANKCVFCFIHQLPKGMRKSLYVKDDDFRLSFLHGNYITLTDLEEAELQRIETQRLSPLYVSVHATDPALRHELLGRPRVRRDLLPVMQRLATAGITMHAQIVLCPGWNDGAPLDRTVHELARLYPAVPTTAVVPVGLTRHRERLPALRPVSTEEASVLVRTIEGWQREFQASLGTRFVWAADELYLQSGIALPAAPAYEGFAVAEDGIGLVRRFEDGFARALARRPGRLARPRRVTVVTGEMYAPRMRALLERAAVPGLDASLAPIANGLFGSGIGVAGLLTGRDIQVQLDHRRADGRDLGEEILVPAVALRDGAGVFLDDLTPADLAAALDIPVTAVEPTAPAFMAALLGR